MDHSVADGAVRAAADIIGQGASTLTSKPAPYGRACVNCVRAKCKCILRNGGENCERCFRLKKECKPSSSVRKRRTTPKQSSQTARLEQKLDGLVSLLKANSQGSLSTQVIEASASTIAATLSKTSVRGSVDVTCDPSPQSPSDYEQEYENPALCLLPPPRAAYQENAILQARSAPITPASSVSSSFSYHLPRDIEPTAEEAEAWFHDFQTRYLERVPFVIPYIQNTSCMQLRHDNPALWLGVIAIACPNVTKQLSLGRAFKELIAREVVVNEAKTTGLLLAILTFSHWVHCFVQLGPMLTTLTYLAASILVELELDKPCQNECNKYLGKQMMPRWSGKFKVPESRTMEHRRLLIAAYSFSTSCAFFHHKAEAVPWSTYHEEVLNRIEEARETRPDGFLVARARLMQVLSNVTKLYTQLRSRENASATQMIVPYIRSLQCQLDNIKNQMPDYVAENKDIQLTILYIQIAIYEPVLIRVQYVPLTEDRELETMKFLLACTQYLRYWKDLFLTLVPEDYIGCPITMWKQLGLVIHTVMRLATLEDPAWDVEHVKSVVNLPAMLDVVCSNLSYISNMEPWKSNVEDDVYKRSRKHMIGLASWINTVFAGHAAQPPVIDQPWPHLKLDGKQQEDTEEQQERWEQVPQQAARPPLQQGTQQMQTTQPADPSSHMLMMNGQAHTSAAATAAVSGQQMQHPMHPMHTIPPDLLPFFNQEPWTEDLFGFWDLYTGGKVYNP